MKSVLITGGAGYIGSVLTEKLLKNNYQVTVLDNLLYKQISLLHLFQYENFKFIRGDVRNTQLLVDLVKSHDIIIPLAAIVGMPACQANERLSIEVNTDKIKTIADNITNQYLILPNTNSQYGSSTEIITESSPFKPLSLYAQTKCMAEDYVLQNKKGVVLRLATVFGVSSRMRQDLLVNDFVYKAVNDEYIVLFEANYKRNYIHVEDIANTFVFIIDNYETCFNNVYNVGMSDANLSKLELTHKIKTYLPNLVIHVDDFKVDFDQRNYIVSNEKLEGLGWKPKHSLDYGIKQLIDAYKIITAHNNRNFTNI